MKSSFVYLVLVLALSLFSCKDNSTGPIANLNAPVITNVTNSFTYSVRANSYTNNGGDALSFTSDSLIVTLSSSEYVSGLAIVSIRDTLNAVIFADSVRSNKTTTIVGLKTTKPKYYSINVTNLTGKLVFVVVGQ